MTALKKWDLFSGKVIHNKFPQLEVALDKFVRECRVSLSQKLRKYCFVDSLETNNMPLQDFTNTLPSPSLTFVLKSNTLNSRYLLLALDNKLAFGLISILFGGEMRPFSVDNKEFTGIETSTLKNMFIPIVELISEHLSEAVETELSFEIHRTETNPNFIAIAPPTDFIIHKEISLEIENLTGSFHLVIPYGFVEPFKKQLLTTYKQEKLSPQDSLSVKAPSTISRLPQEVSLVLGETELNISELQKLHIGQVIPLKGNINEGIDLVAGNNKLAKVFPFEDWKKFKIGRNV